jgi:hypothetical protein
VAVCPSCGVPLDSTIRFCPACGTRISSEDAIQKDPSPAPPGDVVPAPPEDIVPVPVDAAPPPPVDIAPPPVAVGSTASKSSNSTALILGGVAAVAALTAVAVVLVSGVLGGGDNGLSASLTPNSLFPNVATTEDDTVWEAEEYVEDVEEAVEEVAEALPDPVPEQGEVLEVPGTVAPPQTIPNPVVVPAPPQIFTPPVIRAVSATAVRSASTDACGNPTFYNPFQIADGNRETAWMAPGNAIGESVIFDLVEPSRVYQVGLIPGYDKIDPCVGSDRFFDLRRITSVRWTFDNGFQTLQDLRPRRELQTIDLGAGVVTSRVILTVLSTTPPGLERLDHTPISEVIIRRSGLRL